MSGRSRNSIHPSPIGCAAVVLALSVAGSAHATHTMDVQAFWSDALSAAFYTIAPAESSTLIASTDFWQHLGSAWSAYAESGAPATAPVYRLWRDRPMRHFFTINEAEKDAVLASGDGWNYAGIAWFTYPEAQLGTLPVYRIYNKHIQSHFFTASPEQQQLLLNNHEGWIDEGIAWHAYPALPGIGDFDHIQMARVNGGCFEMGSPLTASGRDADERSHPICVEDFVIGRHEVTQAQWTAIMGVNPSWWIDDCGDCPVEMVSWDAVQDFLIALNYLTGKNYRLPTELEWEYACRGGGLAHTYCGGEDPDQIGWHLGNSGGRPRPVGQSLPNAFGLYDMSGNVAEWTCSLYEPNYGGAEKSCMELINYGYRVVRGGAWNQPARMARAADREALTSAARSEGLGLRLAHD